MREDQIIVGGQAVIEGVMMRAPHSYAVAVRRPDGRIVSKAELLPAPSEKYPLFKLPVLRGSAVLIQSMVLGIKALNFSANVVFHEAESEAPVEQPQLEAAGVGPAIGNSPTANTVNTAAVSVAPISRVSSVATISDKHEKETKGGPVAAGAVGSIVFALFF